MDFHLPPELAALADEATQLALSSTEGLAVTEDSWIVGTSRELSLELGRRGWLGMTWPARWGGHERSALERFVVVEALIANGAPIATSWFADRQIGPTLLQFGTDDQRDLWLPPIAAGASAWCIGMSEPDAGSDVAGIRTRATRDRRGDWVVDGAKVWTSGAAEADWCYLIARTDPDAPAHAGLSELVVDMSSEGIEVRRIADATGNEHFCELRFDGVRVPAANLVGTENDSFRQVMRQMEHERGGIDRLVSNHRLYLDARSRLLREHRVDPLLEQQMARIETGYRIGRLMVLREVLAQAPPGWSAVTKTWCTELEQQVAELCVQVAGAEALLWGRVARGICYAPAYTLMGGTTQILRNIIGERMLGLPREPRR
jgi:alkylation response protein AidB-like acyl-CoA dehydrogenase